MTQNARERKNDLYSKLSGSKSMRATETAPLDPAKWRSEKSKNENFFHSRRNTGRSIQRAKALARKSIASEARTNVMFIKAISVCDMKAAQSAKNRIEFAIYSI